MGDDRTTRILKRRHTAKLWAAAVAGGIIGAVLEWVFDWKPVAFVLARFQDVQSLAEGVDLFPPRADSWEYHLLELASAPVAGILLVLTFAGLPWGRALLKRLFPDPPPFLRSDLAAECTRTMTLAEEPLPAFVGREAERETLMSFAMRSKT